MTSPAPVSKLNDYLTALARTVVPIVVGVVVTFALRHGVDLHVYTPVITAAVSFGYYALVHFAEHYIDPAFGWLLGIAKSPAYKTITAAAGPTIVHTVTVNLEADTNKVLKDLAAHFHAAAERQAPK